MKRLYSLAICTLLACTMALAANDVAVSKGLVKRLFPEKASFFTFKKIHSDKDIFALQSRNGKLIIEGNNANSMAVGLNYYLKRYCLTSVSWYKDDPIELPQTMPEVPTRVEIAAKLPQRFFLNYCTYGYTLPWWTWKEWEHLIDWMALNGVNMPLAITGSESVWYKTWKRFGLTDNEIRSFFSGPAFLGWHRMCNFDSYMGPLPKQWMDSQEALQRKILARERAFNMKPVLPGFAGHIPAALKKHYPNMQATPVSYWGGFKDPDKYRCTFLFATDPMYAKIQRVFLQEQAKLYGTSHIYGVDPFNEVAPPTLNSDSLSLLSAGIYKSLSDVDKDAVWLQMGWTFYLMKYWNNERQRALFRGVPQGKLLMLDYWCDNKEMWPRTESYFGQPFIWCYLNNFGGRNRLVAPTDKLFDRIDNAYRNAGGNFKGLGATLEAFDVNQFAFDMLFDKAWDIPGTLVEWRNNLADIRVGKASTNARKAYNYYCEKVLDIHRDYDHTLLESRPTMNIKSREKPNPAYKAEIQTWRMLLDLNANRDAYKMDIVNVGRQCLADYFYVLWRKFLLYYDVYDVENMQKTGNRMKETLADCAALTACHPVFSLKTWIDQARNLGDTAAEKDYYERNARTILTTWTDKLTSINDYAGRPWDGLISSFYTPRWTLFIDRATAARKQGKDFDEETFARMCFDFEQKFANVEVPIAYPKAQEPLPLAKKLYEKYFNPNIK